MKDQGLESFILVTNTNQLGKMHFQAVSMENP